MRRLCSHLNLFCTTLFLCVLAFLAAPFLDPKGEAVHRLARFWATIYLKIAGVAVTFHGKQHIGQPPYILMSNHQSALDIMSLLKGLPISFRFVAKQELFKIPLFGWALKRAGYISLDRQNPRQALKDMDVAAKRIRDGSSLVIFPEGTRSLDGRLLPFKKGAFSLAMKAGVPIVPVAIRGTAVIQPEGCHVPARKGSVTIVAGEPIAVDGKGTSYKDALAEKVKTEIERLMAIDVSGEL
ncbi:MAG TPA: 1-acyl-sn-glycerol-3-phosphate acyltransferase [Deltaproteobacteria bacterium]|nr:1-acyl-sn-glycerol-3-phosphate acyltransferase [Deltaproteobacteria bacterium]